jgi:hypothetical protein
MDYLDQWGYLIFADPDVDKDFHHGKKLPRINDYSEADYYEDEEILEDGSVWFFHPHYSHNGDFRATWCNGVRIHHGENEFEVIADVKNDETRFYLLPNQSMIRVLLVLMFFKQPKQSHSLSKIPVELFRLLKTFLEK